MCNRHNSVVIQPRHKRRLLPPQAVPLPLGGRLTKIGRFLKKFSLRLWSRQFASDLRTLLRKSSSALTVHRTVIHHRNAASLLAATRSHSRGNNALCCFLTRSCRFATPQKLYNGCGLLKSNFSHPYFKTKELCYEKVYTLSINRYYNVRHDGIAVVMLSFQDL